MAGGTWSATELPVLPGLYLNFQAAALAAIQAGARGIVVAPVKAHWGPVNQLVEITSEADIIDKYTADESGGATAYTTLRFALMGGAKKLLAYRLADSSAANAALTLMDATSTGIITLKTIYPTDRDFSVVVQTNSLNNANTDIVLYEGTTKLRTFTFDGDVAQAAVDAINNDTGNSWIQATKVADGTIANITKTSLPSGNAGLSNVLAADYVSALAAFETQEFNILTLDGVTDAGIQTSVVTWVNRLRGEGKGIIAVVGGSNENDTAKGNVDPALNAVGLAISRSASLNSEGIVNVGVGVILDGVSYCSAQVAAYVAGLIAGQKLSESTTYAVTPFDDVTRRWTRSEQEDAVKNGVFLLFQDGRMVKVLRGMNSLVTLSQGQNNSWKKIRTIRVMDAVNADLLRAAEDNYIGKVNNTEEGRLALIGACKQYMESLSQGGVIEATGWDVYLNPVYYGQGSTITPEPDQVYLKWEARLTDVMEIILGTFIVK
jgi:hypothetical protein